MGWGTRSARFELRHNLPFLGIGICHDGHMCAIADVLIDTGSATTVLSVDALAPARISPRPTDLIRTIRGVGGAEAVFCRRLDYLQVGDVKIRDFDIEVAGMDYGFGINGILGMDFLGRSGAVLDLKGCSIGFKSR